MASFQRFAQEPVLGIHESTIASLIFLTNDALSSFVRQADALLLRFFSHGIRQRGTIKYTVFSK